MSLDVRVLGVLQYDLLYRYDLKTHRLGDIIWVYLLLSFVRTYSFLTYARAHDVVVGCFYRTMRRSNIMEPQRRRRRRNLTNDDVVIVSAPAGVDTSHSQSIKMQKKMIVSHSDPERDERIIFLAFSSFRNWKQDIA